MRWTPKWWKHCLDHWGRLVPPILYESDYLDRPNRTTVEWLPDGKPDSFATNSTPLLFYSTKNQPKHFLSLFNRIKELNKKFTLSSGGHLYKLRKVCCIFLANLGANTSLSEPNWCLDCRTIESITYKPGTLYSGLHFNMNFSTLCTTCL